MKTNKKGQNMLMGLFITVILLVIIGSIAMTFIQTNQARTTVTDDQFLLTANGTCIDITDNCISSVSNVEYTSNGSELPTALYTTCESTAGSLDTDGIITNQATNFSNMNATYTEESCTRVQGMGGTVVGYASVVLALAIFAFLAGAAIKK